MGVYHSFKEMAAVLEDQLKKRGTRVGGTLELTNVYSHVLAPRASDLSPHLPWANLEFAERISGQSYNPGYAWEVEPEIWGPMLERPEGGDPRFSYTYSDRMSHQLGLITREFRESVDTRQAYLAIWNVQEDIPHMVNKRRIPCSLGYQFLVRDGALILTYLQRSCNFLKHFQDDLYLAFRLQEWMANQVGVRLGSFHHWVGSLHIFI